ncbi:MAG: ectonucleotide pyrophosphatase/phosphodiesterase [Bacteroidota bacterium]
MRIPSFLLALFLLAGCASGAMPEVLPEASGERTPLILISIDGMRHDYFDRDDADTPTLDAMVASGVRAESLVPSYPTKTFPNHYTLVTGLHPEQHGIVGNTMLDPTMGDSRGDTARFSLGNRDAVTDGRWWGGEPIWVTAENAGIRTGTVSWPGSEAEILGVRPTDWLVYDGDRTYDSRIDTALEWIDAGAGFVTLYFEGVDSQGHRHGPLAPETAAALEGVDAALARLMDGLRQRQIAANVVVVSDHGMTPVHTPIYLDDVLDLDAETEAVIWGEAAGVWPSPEADVDAMVARIDALDHVSATRREDVPERFVHRDHHRIPPVVVMPEAGYTISSRGYVERRGMPSGGAHGYDNAHPDMGGVFVASGPAFRSGETTGPLAAVDVVGILAQALGIEAAENAGDPDAPGRVLR